MLLCFVERGFSQIFKSSMTILQINFDSSTFVFTLSYLVLELWPTREVLFQY